MAAGSCNSIAKMCIFSDVRLSLLHKKGTQLKKIFQRSSAWTRQIQVVYKTIQTVKSLLHFKREYSHAMKVPRFRCLLEIQGVTEQNVSRSPKYLIN